LFGTITTPANSVVVFTSNGGLINIGLPGDHVRVAIRLLVDGVIQEFGEYDVEDGNFSSIGRWSLSIALPLPAGVHTVGVQAQMTDIHKASSSPSFPRAQVAGTADTTVHGTLTAIVLNK
jgi:hypothetical protein